MECRDFIILAALVVALGHNSTTDGQSHAPEAVCSPNEDAQIEECVHSGVANPNKFPTDFNLLEFTERICSLES
jgi:hypothetical protein